MRVRDEPVAEDAESDVAFSLHLCHRSDPLLAKLALLGRLSHVVLAGILPQGRLAAGLFMEADGIVSLSPYSGPL